MLEIGIKGEAKTIVTEQNTAKTYASGALPVFATPAMIGLMEQAAHDSLLAHLDEGQGTVGTTVDIRHLAATPVGMAVRATSELTAIDGRRLTFTVAAYDEAGVIGKGTHERFIIDVARFMQKAQDKLK
jgi:predicted thioesterase